MIGLAASPLRRCCRALAVAVAATPLVGCSGSARGERADAAGAATRSSATSPTGRTRGSGWISTCPTVPPRTRRCWCSSTAATGRAGRRSSTGSWARPSPRGATSPRSRTIALYPEVRYPTFIEDGALAIDWLADAAGHGRRAQAVRRRPFRRRLHRRDAGARPALAGWRVRPGLRAHRGDGRARRPLRLPAACATPRSGGLRPRTGEPGFAADQPCEPPAIRRCCWPPAPRTAPCARATASPWPSA